jgi:hypothetical protein
MGFQCVDWKFLVVDIISKTMLFLTTQNFFQIFLFFIFWFFLHKGLDFGCRIWQECGQVNQKILAIEMVTEIRSLFLMIQKQFKGFFSCQKPNLGRWIVIKVWTSRMKKIWLLKWWPKSCGYF